MTEGYNDESCQGIISIEPRIVYKGTVGYVFSSIIVPIIQSSEVDSRVDKL